MGEDTWLPASNCNERTRLPGFALLPYVVHIDDDTMVSAAQDGDAFIVAERDMLVAAEANKLNDVITWLALTQTATENALVAG